MNRDTWIGIIGCVLLVAAMVGVFTYERANAQAGATSDASDTSAGASGPALSDTVALGETKTALTEFNVTSARNVTFTLGWSATNGRDTLKLTVAPPTGSGIMEGGVSPEEDDGEITLTIQVPEDASPQGPWEVKVEFVRATPDPLPGGVPPPSPIPAQTDSIVAFTVETMLS